MMKLGDALVLLDNIAKNDPVPCNGCTACCRGNQAVCLREGDDPEAYGQNLNWENCHGTMQLTLKRQKSGDCNFLVLGACSIYAKRPTVCRRFDCRRIVAMLTPSERKQAVRNKLFDQEIMDAGVDRLPTLTLTPEEEHLRDGGLGDMMRDRGLL